MKLRTLTNCTIYLFLMSATIGCAGARTAAPESAPPAAPAPGSGPAFADLPNAFDAPGGVASIPLNSEVTAVTVYSDRARITRRATAQVTTESKVFAFGKLPGWVDDGSVNVAASAGRIVDVRVERTFLAKATDKLWREAEDEHRELTGRLAALTDEIAVLDEQKAQIAAIKAFSLEKITHDTTIGDVKVESYADVLTFISDSLRKTASARREVQTKMDALLPQVEASARRLEEMKALMKLEETTVLVTLQSSQPAASTLELTYLMPGATWEPMHELRVSSSDAKKVEVVSFAAVTQTSGEDWGHAELSFSTQSTSESMRIPELDALTLGDTHTSTRMLGSKISSFTRAQEAFSGQSQLWNKVHAGSAAAASHSVDIEAVYQSNMEYLQVVQSKTVQIFETLQNRGTTAHFKADAALSVRGDGHPTRIRIGRSELGSEQKIIAVPEQSLNAARTLEMVNSTGQALLPGKVALYRDGTFLGLTEIDFIAEGEAFSMFLSVADHIKLSRTLDRKRSSLVQNSRNKMRVSFLVEAENLSGKASVISLADRIPVSENKEIKVSNVEITPAVRPSSRGLLNWEVKLEPEESRQFRISYEVEYPSELILDARRRRAMESASPSAAPARAMDRSKLDIQEQLVDLEEML